MINNNIQEDYCSFEVSKLLREKGCRILTPTHFNEVLSGEGKFRMIPKPLIDYSNSCDYPILPHSLAIKWIRENFGIDVSSHCDIGDRNFYCYTITRVKQMPFWRLHYNIGNFKFPHEATEAALMYTLSNIIKN